MALPGGRKQNEQGGLKIISVSGIKSVLFMALPEGRKENEKGGLKIISLYY